MEQALQNTLGFGVKECQNCSKEYRRNPKYSKQQWAESRFCGLSCQRTGKKVSASFKYSQLGVRGREAISGENSHLWRGGVTSKSERSRKSQEYKEWRQQVLIRDDYTCQMCSKRGGDLEVDYLLPFAYYEDIRFEVLNGQTLCKPCHKKTDTYGEKAKTFIN